VSEVEEALRLLAQLDSQGAHDLEYDAIVVERDEALAEVERLRLALAEVERLRLALYDATSRFMTRPKYVGR
jgi:hypothetical protein